MHGHLSCDPGNLPAMNEMGELQKPARHCKWAVITARHSAAELEHSKWRAGNFPVRHLSQAKKKAVPIMPQRWRAVMKLARRLQKFAHLIPEQSREVSGTVSKSLRTDLGDALISQNTIFGLLLPLYSLKY